jgi:hypothetical protein
MLFNSVVWNTTTSFYQILLGFRNRVSDQSRLNYAFQSLQRYTYVDFVRDINVLNLSRNRDTLLPFRIADPPIQFVFYVRRLFEEREINTLVYMFRMMRELGSGDNANSPMLAEFTRMDRVMGKIIERRQDVVEIVTDEESGESEEE